MLYFKALQGVVGLLHGRLRHRALAVLLLTFFGSLVDVAGLMLVVPVIYLIAEPGRVHDHELLSRLCQAFQCKGEYHFIMLLLLGLLAIFLVKNLFLLIVEYVQNKFSFSISFQLLESQLTRFHQTTLENYVARNPGYFLRDIAILPNDFSLKIFIPLIVITNELMVLAVIVAGLLAFKADILLMLSVTLLPIALLTMSITKRRAFAISEERNRAEPEKYKRVSDNINAFVDIRIFGRESVFIARAVKPFRELYNLYVRTLFYQGLPQRIMEVVVVLTIAVAFYFVVFLFGQSSSSLVLTLSLFATAAYRVMPSADRIMKMLINIRTNHYVLEALTLWDPGVAGRPGRQEISGFETSVSLKSVGFGYGGSGALFKAIDFDLPKGTITGLTGESGTGKTTLIRILAGLSQGYSGEVRIDGRAMDPEVHNWTAMVSLVQQDIGILNLSLAENVAYGLSPAEIDRDRLNQALELVSLDDFIKGADRGVDMELKDDGRNLSGGQKQRVALARALYAGRQLLLLDEATNALDEATEARIMETIRRLVQKLGLTVLVVSHRPTALQFCDRIFRLAGGKLEQV